MSDLHYDRINKKYFVGRDLIDRIYFCPANGVVVLDYNETNKIGIMLLDYLRLESNYEVVRKDYDVLLSDVNKKVEEESQKIYSEKNNLIKQ
jgi:hypothetical protein